MYRHAVTLFTQVEMRTRLRSRLNSGLLLVSLCCNSHPVLTVLTPGTKAKDFSGGDFLLNKIAMASMLLSGGGYTQLKQILFMLGTGAIAETTFYSNIVGRITNDPASLRCVINQMWKEEEEHQIEIFYHQVRHLFASLRLTTVCRNTSSWRLMAATPLVASHDKPPCLQSTVSHGR